jgi:hypothetical protein
MKRLLLASLVAPGVASAGVLIVDAKAPAHAPVEQQSSREARAPELALSAPVEPVKPEPTWMLTAGDTIGQDLQAWGQKSGWKVIWNMSKDWSVPASTVFSGDFKGAASSVVKTLAANGALVRAQFFDGNKTMVVSGPGVATQ